jgi:hypothetical protein
MARSDQGRSIHGAWACGVRGGDPLGAAATTVHADTRLRVVLRAVGEASSGSTAIVQPVRQTADLFIMSRSTDRAGLAACIVVGLLGCGPEGEEPFDPPIPDTLVFVDDRETRTVPFSPLFGGSITNFNTPYENFWLAVPPGSPFGFALDILRGSRLEPVTYPCNPYSVTMRLVDSRGRYTSKGGRCQVTLTRIQRDPTPRITGTFSAELVGTSGQAARTLTNGRFDFVPRIE